MNHQVCWDGFANQSSWVSAQPTPTGRLAPASERADTLSTRVATFAEPVKPYTVVDLLLWRAPAARLGGVGGGPPPGAAGMVAVVIGVPAVGVFGSGVGDLSPLGGTPLG